MDRDKSWIEGFKSWKERGWTGARVRPIEGLKELGS